MAMYKKKNPRRLEIKIKFERIRRQMARETGGKKK